MLSIFMLIARCLMWQSGKVALWQNIYNPSFNYGEFATIRNQSGLNSLNLLCG